MKLRLYLLTVALALVVVTPAAGIIGGQPDGNGHPNVGAIDMRVIGSPFPCSGTLISSTVFLTAGHCTTFLQSAGVNTVRVTFNSVFSDSGTFYTGAVHTNPAFTRRQNDPGDMGVIVFNTPVVGITPASLPTQGLLDELAPQGLRNETFTFVGYGASSLVGGANGGGRPGPDPRTAWTRRFGVAGFLSLTPGWVRFDASAAPGCVGDSGAPFFLGSTGVIAAIGTQGDNACAAMGAGTRLDTTAARTFLGGFVALP